MKKEELEKMGLSGEQAEKVMAAIDGDYVTKARFNEVSGENKTLKQSLTQRESRIAQLEKDAGEAFSLKERLDLLTEENGRQKKAYQEEISKIRLEGAVETAVTAAGARNNKAVKALIDFSRVSLGEDGALHGLNEQLEAMKSTEPYLFREENVGAGAPAFRGFHPGEAGDLMPGGDTDTSSMTYSQMVEYLAQNPSYKL